HITDARTASRLWCISIGGSQSPVQGRHNFGRFSTSNGGSGAVNVSRKRYQAWGFDGGFESCAHSSEVGAGRQSDRAQPPVVGERRWQCKQLHLGLHRRPVQLVL